MNRRLDTFHTGKYLFLADICIDTSIINEAMNVFCRMPVFPETVSHLKENAFEKAVFSESKLEENPATYDQVCRITSHDRENFSQDMSAIEVINIAEAIRLVDNRLNEELSPELISEIHEELISSLNNIQDEKGSYRNGGLKADAKWLEAEYTPPFSKIDINLLIKTLIEWLENDLSEFNPIVKAILLHLHLKKIQPFFNANAHTARIMEIWYLKKNNIRVLPYILVQIYKGNKSEYYKHVSEFYKSSDATSFINFVCEFIKDDVFAVRDKNFEAFSTVISEKHLDKLLENKEIIKRQYELLKLLKENKLTFRQEDLQLKALFTKLYGKVSRTTVTRDITKLLNLGLIIETSEGFVFNEKI